MTDFDNQFVRLDHAGFAVEFCFVFGVIHLAVPGNHHQHGLPGHIKGHRFANACGLAAKIRGGFGYGGAGFLKFHHTVCQAKIGQVSFYFIGSHYCFPLK